MESADINKEINARIYLQTQHLSPMLNLSIEDNSKLFATTLDVTLKLQAMVYHIENYRNLDKHYKNDAIKLFQEFPSTTTNCCSLIYELEAFLFQLKSALDMAIKVLGTLLPNYFKTKTFGNKGEHLIKNLENYKLKQKDRTVFIDSIIEIIRSDQNIWLKDSIELRNTISHYKSMRFFAYKVKKENGQISIEKPNVLNIEPLHFMETTFTNCMEFIQDLISFSIILYLPPAFILTKPNVPDSWNNDGFGKYIKYSLGIDTDKVQVVDSKL